MLVEGWSVPRAALHTSIFLYAIHEIAHAHAWHEGEWHRVSRDRSVLSVKDGIAGFSL